MPPQSPSEVRRQFDRVLDPRAEKLPRVADHLEAACADALAFGGTGGRRFLGINADRPYCSALATHL